MNEDKSVGTHIGKFIIENSDYEKLVGNKIDSTP